MIGHYDPSNSEDVRSFVEHAVREGFGRAEPVTIESIPAVQFTFAFTEVAS